MRARLLVLLLALAAVAAAPRSAHADETRSSADARERSRIAFRKGVVQLRAQDWAAARTSFESAWTLFPHPSILLNLANARLHTDDPAAAEQDLVRFLSEDGGASREELGSARELLAEARARLGSLRIVAMPLDARVVVDGTAAPTVRRADPGTNDVVAELRIKPGLHVVVVTAAGHVPAQRDVDVVAKEEAVVTFALAPIVVATTPLPPPPHVTTRSTPTRTIVGWSLVGGTGAALVAGGVMALRAKGIAGDYADRSSPQFQDASARSEGMTFRSAADVALGIAIVSGVTAIVLLATDLGRGGSRATWRTAAGIVHW